MAKDKASQKETAVRTAAAGLLEAINDARAAGYAVTWPGRPEDLAGIEVSETGSTRPDADQADKLTPVAVDGRREFGDAPAGEGSKA